MGKEISISKDSLIHYLKTENVSEIEGLLNKANKITEKYYKNFVYFRGIIEFSNICQKNCFYCGLRKDLKITRYLMSKKEILNSAKFCYESGYKSIVLQSAELENESRIEFISDVIFTIKKKYNLGITLSLGELKKENLKSLFKNGAHRYLLRIETSNEKLYNKIHPKDHSFQNRLNTLENLKSLGYQVGTGVMIGLPSQTHEDLANDILFYKQFDIDMLGMGPYIPHPQTPLFNETVNLKDPFTLSLKMIALTRMLLKNVNIAATTAMQAIHPKGREKALNAGANILMPIVTPTMLREKYLIYPNKPCIEDTKEKCFTCLQGRLKSINKEIGYNKFGDSLHFFQRSKNDT